MQESLAPSWNELRTVARSESWDATDSKYSIFFFKRAREILKKSSFTLCDRKFGHSAGHFLPLL